MKLRIISIIGLLSVAGCATVPAVPQRIAAADAVARKAGFFRTRVTAGPFLLAAYEKIREPGAPLHVYIEGDGYAWVTPMRASGDPTPLRPLAIELAAADPARNVVYLARPGQYTAADSAEAIHETYWTDRRFSEEVIDAMDSAISRFMKDAGSTQLHLIGYSGGAAVAVLVAARRDDVRSICTVAGNLDPAALNAYHNVSPPDSSSLDPMAVAKEVSDVPQCHFVGANDAVVPRSIAESFAERSGRNARVIRVDGADHENGWTEAWPRLLKCHAVAGEDPAVKERGLR